MKHDNIIAKRSNKIIYRDGDSCVKLFAENFSKQDVLNEALNQARVETTGLNIPGVRAVTVIDGKWAIAFDLIEGETLAQLMANDPENKHRYIDLLVDIQMDIHKHSCAHLNRLKEKMSRKIGAADLDHYTRYELLSRLEAMPKHLKLCHGDICPSNIIISKDGTPYVIDWAHATQGNASADVARTYLVFCLSGDEEAAKYYLDRFCEKSGTDKRYVQSWMPIVAASQSVKGRPEERDLLMSWINVVDWQ